MFFSQLAILMGEVFRRQITGTGGFVFMSFIFFGIRPIYIILENDHSLFNRLFLIYPDLAQIHENMLWATLALLVFKIGSSVISARINVATQNVNDTTSTEKANLILVSQKMSVYLLLYQLLTLPLMAYLAAGGRALYGSALGAFAYDFPTVMQAGHIFGFVVILERYLQRKDAGDLLRAIVSGLLFLYFTWLMREVSMFRGFYLAGVMIIGIAALDRCLPRVSLIWLILPVIIFQPFFQTLGQTRNLDNERLVELGLVEQTFGDQGVTERYWEFYSGKGDINIFDTFVAARSSEPNVTPHLWSWAYAPLHVIPRKLWSGKPERGITQDLSFMNGAPYAPGIAGFFWLDGASDWWMLFCMALLGAVVGYADCLVLSMQHGYLRACLLGIIAVNAMFLTRFFLWQALWQTLYAVVPILLMYGFLAPQSTTPPIQEEALDSEKAI